jgi:hypothetical protein
VSIVRWMKDASLGILALVATSMMFFVGLALMTFVGSFSVWVVRWIPLAGVITLAVTIFLLGPLAFIPPTRAFSSVGYMIASFAFGALLWVGGMALTYAAWGVLGVMIGLFILGVGVVPIGMLAALIHGDWGDLAALLLMTVLTYGCRMLSVWLGQKVGERAAPWATGGF